MKSESQPPQKKKKKKKSSSQNKSSKILHSRERREREKGKSERKISDDSKMHFMMRSTATVLYILGNILIYCTALPINAVTIGESEIVLFLSSIYFIPFVIVWLYFLLSFAFCIGFNCALGLRSVHFAAQ